MANNNASNITLSKMTLNSNFNTAIDVDILNSGEIYLFNTFGDSKAKNMGKKLEDMKSLNFWARAEWPWSIKYMTANLPVTER